MYVRESQLYSTCYYNQWVDVWKHIDSKNRLFTHCLKSCPHVGAIVKKKNQCYWFQRTANILLFTLFLTIASVHVLTLTHIQTAVIQSLQRTSNWQVFMSVRHIWVVKAQSSLIFCLSNLAIEKTSATDLLTQPLQHISQGLLNFGMGIVEAGLTLPHFSS